MAITFEVNGIEIPYVKADLKTKIPNNSFTDKFEVPHAAYPLRLIEGKSTKDALGDFSLTGNKQRFYSCIIRIGGSIHNAEIEQLSRIGPFRKVNISYKNPLTNVLEKKASEYFPPVNLLGDDPFENPYTEESEVLHNAFTEWISEANWRKSARFPTVTWQMATLNFSDFFTEEGEEPEVSYDNYLGFMNARGVDLRLHENELTVSTDELEVKNFNLFQPQVFVLAPIEKALAAAGYNLRGSWASSVYAQSLLFDSYNHNMTEVTVGVTGSVIDLDAVPFVQGRILTPEFSTWPGIATYYKKIDYTTTSTGEFKVRFKFTVGPTSMYGFFAKYQQELLEGFFSLGNDTKEGDIRFDVFVGEVGDTIELYYWCLGGHEPLEYSIEVVKNIDDLQFLDAHPTIDFGRYMPEWTVSELINNLKNTYNLKIDIDEVNKVLYLNKNEEDYLINGEAVKLTKDLNVADFNNIETEAFLLKFANNEDAAPLVTKEGIFYDATVPENVVKIENKFKVVPYASTHVLSKALEDKDGQGLMLYNPNLAPATTDKVEGQTLTFEGEGNILEHNWRSWLKFRLNSGRPKASGPFTKTQLDKISETKKIWLNNILFLVTEINYKETNTGLYWVDMDLESVTY